VVVVVSVIVPVLVTTVLVTVMGSLVISIDPSGRQISVDPFDCQILAVFGWDMFCCGKCESGEKAT